VDQFKRVAVVSIKATSQGRGSTFSTCSGHRLILKRLT